MGHLHINTPLIKSRTLGAFVKMDALQPSGSFKIRGIGHLCQDYVRRGKVERFLSSSGGNAGMAVAYAGRKLGVPVHVVVPETASKLMMEKIRAEGAEVTIHGQDWNGADEKVQQILKLGGNSAYIPPFDHPLIWEGHSTLVTELVQEGVKPDVIILAVGGGGLLCGVLQGLHRVGWQDVPVVVVETTGAASLAAALNAGYLVTLPKISTIAVSLGARRVAEEAFKWTRKHEVISVLVEDSEATKACIRFANEQRVLVEPSCGAALAALYQNHVDFCRFKAPLVIACGGNAVSLELLSAWRKESEHP